MNSFADLLKNKLTIISGIVSLIIAVGSSAYAVDQRYMKVDDYNKAQIRFERRQLEDKLFELEFKIASDGDSAKPLDKALKERFRQRLESLSK